MIHTYRISAIPVCGRCKRYPYAWMLVLGAGGTCTSVYAAVATWGTLSILSLFLAFFIFVTCTMPIFIGSCTREDRMFEWFKKAQQARGVRDHPIFW